jgi:ribokinase
VWKPPIKCCAGDHPGRFETGHSVSHTSAIGTGRLRWRASDRIDTQPIEAIADSTTGVALIFVNAEGENVIGIDAGANAAVTPDYLARYQQKVIDADALLMQLESPLDTVIAAARLAKQHHTQVILRCTTRASRR